MNAKFIALSLIIVSCLVTIGFISSKETSYILLDASYLADNKKEYTDSNLRVRGFVELGSISKKGRSTDFILSLHEKQVKVHFTGENLLPDAFKEGARVRVDGRLENNILVAERVEAKCASKYEAGYENQAELNYDNTKKV